MIKSNNFERQDWSELSTSTISDALDKLRIQGQCFGITPLKRDYKIIGLAYTIKYESQSDQSGTVGDYVENVEPGEIIVIDNDGRNDATVWGDLLTRFARIRKIGGTVINGVCRDTNSNLECNYPIFSKGTYMRTGKGRVQFCGENIPVMLGGVLTRPKDLIVGDADGVVVVPNERIDEVLRTALQIHETELAIGNAINQGKNLEEARRSFSYHSLQKPT